MCFNHVWIIKKTFFGLRLHCLFFFIFIFISLKVSNTIRVTLEAGAVWVISSTMLVHIFLCLMNVNESI